MRTRVLGVLAAAGLSATATAGVADNYASIVDASRTFNDFSGSNLNFNTDFANGTVSFTEDDYGVGGFANRHIAWYGDAGNNPLDFNYQDRYDATVKMQIAQADGVGQVEAGMQVDNFGFGFFGVLSGSGEIAAFGGYLEFHTFGTGLYSVGDELLLRMIYNPGAGEGSAPAGTMEYMYNNLTTGSGWVSSGAKVIANLEGGIPSAGLGRLGVGAQINQPHATDGAVAINWSMINLVPAPGAGALLGLGGLVAVRRRR